MTDVLDNLETFDLGSIGSGTKFAGPPPYLGIILCSEKRASEYEDAKNPEYWKFDVLDVRSKTGFVHRNKVNPSGSKRSKMGYIVESLKSIFKGQAFTLVPKDGSVSPLIGKVAWFEQNDELLKYNGQTYAFTRAVKMATAEETAEGREALENYVPPVEETTGGDMASTIQPSQVETFDWTEEYIQMALGVLDGQTDKSVLGVARKVIPAEDSGLRNAVNAGAAAEVLTEKGLLVKDEGGVYHKTEAN